MCLIREAKFGNDSLAFYFFFFLFSLSLKCSAVYNMVLATWNRKQKSIDHSNEQHFAEIEKIWSKYQ